MSKRFFDTEMYHRGKIYIETSQVSANKRSENLELQKPQKNGQKQKRGRNLLPVCDHDHAKLIHNKLYNKNTNTLDLMFLRKSALVKKPFFD